MIVSNKCWSKQSRMSCKYSASVTFVVLLMNIVIVAQWTTSISCQNQQQPQTDCNHQRHANKPQRQHFNHPTDNQLDAEASQKLLHRQRNFSARQAKAVEDQLVAKAANLDAEQDEFSLGSSLAQHRNNNNNNYTILNSRLVAEPDQQIQSSNQTTPDTPTSGSSMSNTTPSMPSDSISSPVVLQPPATTTSSLVMSSTLGSSGRQQQMSITTTSISPVEQVSSESPVAPIETGEQVVDLHQRPHQALARRIDDEQAPGMSVHGSRNQLDGRQFDPRQYQMRQEELFASQPAQYSNQRHAVPMSSSPSSISIITPLSGAHQETHTSSVSASIGGPASMADNQQQSMMKPILVLGNPINLADYSNSNSGAELADSSSKSTVESDQLTTKPTTQLDTQQVLKGVSHNKLSSGEAENSLHQKQPSSRSEKSSELSGDSADSAHKTHLGDRIQGPPLAYSDGQLGSVLAESLSGNQSASNITVGNQPQVAARLNSGQNGGAAVLPNSPRRPSLPPPVNQANAASGFRSPMSPSGPLIGGQSQSAIQPAVNQAPSQSMSISSPASFYQTSPPYAGNNLMPANSLYNNNLMLPQSTLGYNKPNYPSAAQQANSMMQQQQQHQLQTPKLQTPTGNQNVATTSTGLAPGYSGRRPLNITRVEHISAECSNDLIRALIVFNGTFKGIIYSSGYVNDPTCLYVNGTGSTRYEFSIRLNQCGTLGRQELHQPTVPGEARRRDQVMWNTLSIQYNSIIEQEWDEHFRVSCEYGSDFWKTVSFSPFNVETNTGSPVVFTINPPQCQMDVLLGHGMGPKIAVDGPVTVGDPLTLLIHMKSEKAGYDILVKNCVAHNGGKQRMQLIDSNGCVVNERFISPFRGTYNDNDLRHVTLYAYLKAFRFTGSPVLYLECEIHMCQSACPPQMCYWRRLSKRSVDNSDFDYEYTNASQIGAHKDQESPIISDSLSLFKALQVRHEPSEPKKARQELLEVSAEDEEAKLVCYRHQEVLIFLYTMATLILLIITIAITCCLRIRKLTKGQFKHNRLASSSGSLSPSLLSISDAISSSGSIIGRAAADATARSLMSLKCKSCQLSPSWQHNNKHHQNQPTMLNKPTHHQQVQTSNKNISSFHMPMSSYAFSDSQLDR